MKAARSMTDERWLVSREDIEARLVPDRSPGPKHLTVWARLDLGIGKEWVAVGRLTGDKR